MAHLASIRYYSLLLSYYVCASLVFLIVGVSLHFYILSWCVLSDVLNNVDGVQHQPSRRTTAQRRPAREQCQA